ncbi:MAG: hypothetical protein P1U90_00765 [Akkermansiaceae bacterium]|nr:hypothetical protein [Akkermansiaceae bacterium]
MNFFPVVFVAAFLAMLHPSAGQLAGENDGAAKPRTGEKLEEEIQELTEQKETTAEERYKSLGDFIESLSFDEIRTYLEHGRYNYTSNVGLRMIERWAFLDHREMLLWLQAEDRKIVRLIEKTGTQGSFSVVGGLRGRQDEVFNSFMRGWSERDPFAAWEATKEPDGKVSYLLPLKDDDGYGHIHLGNLIYRLAKVDPKKAWEEFDTFPETKYRWVYRESLLKGISSGMPEVPYWQVVLEKAIELCADELEHLKPVLRERLFGRWLAKNPVAAEAWYQSEAGKIISTRSGTTSLEGAFFTFLAGGKLSGKVTYRVPLSMTPSVKFWLSRDFKTGLTWLKTRPEIAKEMFTAFHGNAAGLSFPEYRAILIECFSPLEREELLRKFMEDDDFAVFDLTYLVDAEEEETVRRGIGELRISPAFTEEIVQVILQEFRGR